MTSGEFGEWFKRHMTSFPGIKTWLEKYPETSQNDLEVTRQGIMAEWFDCLSVLTKEEAVAATRELFRRTRNERPAYEQHPAEVLDLGLRSRQPAHYRRAAWRRIDGHNAIKCRLCEDQGHVIVWSDKAVAAVRAILDKSRSDCAHDAAQRYLDRGHPHNAAATCTCDAAIGFATGPKGELVFDPKWHFVKRYEDTLDDLFAAVKARVADEMTDAFGEEGSPVNGSDWDPNQDLFIVEEPRRK